MSRVATFTVLVVTHLVWISEAAADLPIGPDLKSVDHSAPLEVTMDDDAEYSRLIVPRQFLEKSENSVSLAPLRTVLAGIALSLAILGLCFVGGSGKTRAVALICVAGGLAVGTIAYLSDQFTTTNQVHSELKPAEVAGVNVFVEIVPEGDTIELKLHWKDHKVVNEDMGDWWRGYRARRNAKERARMEAQDRGPRKPPLPTP